MNIKHFSLFPFGLVFDPAILELSVTVLRDEQQMMLRYSLFDDQAQVLIPTSNSSSRQHNLWKATCFEFFIAVQNSRKYWEFNLSPSGDWNVYRFDDYRVGMQEEIAFTSLPFEVETRSKQTSLTIELDLNAIAQSSQTLDIGVAAVIQHLDRSLTYWAIEHCGAEADFHLRNSFVLRL